MKKLIKKENIHVICEDGISLKGVLLMPENPKAVVQFNCGTGAKKEFYLPYLEFLSENGYICCLWDYRGSGESAPPSLKNCEYRFQDYGLKDIPAVKNFLRSKFPDLPFLVIGHSAGGQQLGFSEHISDIKGLLCFAVSTGYMGFMPIKYRLLTMYFFKIFSPVSNILTGYVAAKRFKIMEDLPKNVVKEWHKWCKKPDYFFNSTFYGKTVPIGNFQNYTFPVHVIWATDDPISNKDSISAYWQNIKSTKGIEIQKITPADYGVKKIDHFGFFRRHMRDSLWQESLEKLNYFINN